MEFDSIRYCGTVFRSIIKEKIARKRGRLRRSWLDRIRVEVNMVSYQELKIREEEGQLTIMYNVKVMTIKDVGLIARPRYSVFR